MDAYSKFAKHPGVTFFEYPARYADDAAGVDPARRMTTGMAKRISRDGKLQRVVQALATIAIRRLWPAFASARNAGLSAARAADAAISDFRQTDT